MGRRGQGGGRTSDAHAVQVSSCEHIPPEGWCSAGTRGFEPRTNGLGRPSLCQLSYIPMKLSGKQNRPLGFPCERLPALSCFLPRSLPGGAIHPGQLERALLVPAVVR